MLFDEDLLSKIIEELNKDNVIALCTIVEKKGSGPGDVGTKMLISSNGDVYGTIGGGSFERLVIKDALKAINESKSRLIRYLLRRTKIAQDAKLTDLECGGEVSVFIDIITPTPKLIIVGAGHIGKSLADLAHMLGFKIIIIDSNKELASKERFPYANKIIIDRIDRALEKSNITSRDLLAIVYGSVEEDYIALKKALELKPRYIGLLGSKYKIKKFKDRLMREGIDLSKFKGAIYAPIGLDIGAKTPEEIAISIIAEIIGILRGARNLPHSTII